MTLPAHRAPSNCRASLTSANGRSTHIPSTPPPRSNALSQEERGESKKARQNRKKYRPKKQEKKTGVYKKRTQPVNAHIAHIPPPSPSIALWRIHKTVSPLVVRDEVVDAVDVGKARDAGEMPQKSAGTTRTEASRERGGGGTRKGEEESPGTGVGVHGGGKRQELRRELGTRWPLWGSTRTPPSKERSDALAHADDGSVARERREDRSAREGRKERARMGDSGRRIRWRKDGVDALRASAATMIMAPPRGDTSEKQL
ncbi:hypothetical protein DFH08DRAFT_940240 [Mycena albidolilacea]|uniref:Uncharacterized protein n=1 Tax=Mycena albidolilacea TaxID=1033008 RepID=A0AAD7EJF8_9AGAR|nr:hypothetical protein DFH08DRAFT_940240 [Mycena albidolilacea]